MKFTKEDIYAELGVLIILAMSLAALFIIYNHYRDEYKWAAPLNQHELKAGQLGYWQYDSLHNVKQLHETVRTRARRMSEFSQGSYVSHSRVGETWALVQKDDTLYLTQRFPSDNISYGSPAQRFLEAFIEPDPAKYRVKPITPEQRQWLDSQLQDYPGRKVQQDIALQVIEYPRTTVLFSLPFLLLACGGLSLTLRYYACWLHKLVGRSSVEQPHYKTAESSVPCQQHTKPVVTVATLLFLGYLLLLQL